VSARTPFRRGQRPLGAKRLAVLRQIAARAGTPLELANALGETRVATVSHIRELVYRSLAESDGFGRYRATEEGARLALSVALLGMRSS